MDANQMLAGLTSDPRMRQLIIVAGAIALALLVRLLFVWVVKVLTRKTQTDIDDRIAFELRRPLITTIILVGLLVAYLEFDAPQALTFVIKGLIVTVIGLLWSVVLVRVGRILLEAVSDRVDQLAWIDTPVNRGRVIDELNTKVYNAFRAAGIEIPYSKQDVYVKELPRQF
jgi:hypothetical protein